MPALKCPFAGSVKVAFTEDGSYTGDVGSAFLLSSVGGGDALRLMCSRFYQNAFADATLAPFMFEEDGAVAHGKRLGDWIVQKLGGEGSPWSTSGRNGMRSTAHAHAWNSQNRPAQDRGRRFKLPDCRVWMRLHFLACRETGLADHAEFMRFYVEFIQHFVGVYERSAPAYAQESAAWSADPANVQRYRENGCKMIDVLGW
ncbi:hypothetical protein FOA52_009097 [Chlamydomonas sp. UWO 241]|nr:hypothetical protein FOA52_009097 [Chlamydomonas sp. UWO 241]